MQVVAINLLLINNFLMKCRNCRYCGSLCFKSVLGIDTNTQEHAYEYANGHTHLCRNRFA